MRFATDITRTPLPYDIARADEVRSAFGEQPAAIVDLLAGTAGCSPYLGGLVLREGDWLRSVLTQDVDAVQAALLQEVAALPQAGLSAALRVAKRRVALWAGLADLAGIWPLEAVTQALTDFADAALQVGLTHLVTAEIARGKLPGQTVDDAVTGAGMVVMALGKMGAGELNYSSDIDLICLFDQDRYDRDDYHDVRAAFVRITRKLATLMSDNTAEGYVFRTDLRLRPDASVTPVCIAMEAAERYYESVGRTWERAAHIKARPCAGDIAAGEAYLARLAPFVWRKHLDFAAIQDAHDMRLKIRDHKGLHGELDLNGHNMKLGRGGIREIEFFTQTRQLIAGGRDPGLRSRQTVEGLSQLAAAGWIPAEVSDALITHYRAHREVEHRLQMINDAQTHDLPANPDGFDRLARFCGHAETEAFQAELHTKLEAVHDLCEGFFAPDTQEQSAVPPWAEATIDRWASYPALRSTRAQELFARLRPGLLDRMEASGRPEETLRAFDGFLAGLPAGVQLFSLFNSNPQLIDLVIDIAATAPDLAVYLSQNAAVFDAVIGGDFFAPWPGGPALRNMLADHLAGIEDYESQLDAARRWTKEWHFRTGVHLLRALIGTDEAAAQYADLAQAVVAALWPVVIENFARRHGPPPGRGGIVLGMGSLGAGRLGPRSDLDLIVLYDAEGVESSVGEKPLVTRVYYARLTKAMITALTVPMAEGKLYEVDMRLRPSGNQGPVATSWQAFQTYQRAEAWTWEHLALTRARAVAGTPSLAVDFEGFRRGLLQDNADLPKIAHAVTDMRRRLAEAKPARSAWEAKLGPGRAQDIELVAQAAALSAGAPSIRNQAQIQAGRRSGLFTDSEANALRIAYDLFRRMEIAGKLLTDAPLAPDVLSTRGLAFVLRAVGERDAAALNRTIAERQSDAAKAIDAALGRAGGNHD
ncbi:glutamate-ammonia-ligase adenylyltransferase [Actibacterium mucosum KCTC 23349]|uniref:Glutamate-ammonia-ligase adenylyltransferase n=1 Tax=Actibacterium mucosum KCTC 23349 TaxID=1454373 RepID=A0A037ZEJ7_9RHOB|nr:[glutamate--ammonia-ligase] adenylyltransferase [Actibacterium mucosum]KAJ54562.1 glutamate-ammonia-ligase adenylyltransferase [Actibacterium mucosum KCTC 23349]